LGWLTWKDHHGVFLVKNLIGNMSVLRQREEEDPGFTDRLNFIDTTYTLRMMNTLTSQKKT
jgi:hypothetical protein